MFTQKIKSSFRKFVLVFFIFSSVLSANAQDPGDPAGDPDIPIDGGVGILVAAGIGYGYKKYRDSRNKSDRAKF